MNVIKMQKIIIFDGICGLCNKSINLLIKLDKKKVFKYTSLQGNFVKNLEIDREIDSIIFYHGGEIFYKSTAILKICKELGGVWNIMIIFYIIPTFMRNFIYDIVAKYRYNIFGKIEQCSVAKEVEKDLFLV